jgi:hypothetical protein
VRLYLKKNTKEKEARDMGQVVEHLPSKYKSLEFCKIPPTKKKKNKLCS